MCTEKRTSADHAAYTALMAILAVVWVACSLLFRYRRTNYIITTRLSWTVQTMSVLWLIGGLGVYLASILDAPCYLFHMGVLAHQAALVSIIAVRLWFLHFRSATARAIQARDAVTSNWFLRNRWYASDRFMASFAAGFTVTAALVTCGAFALTYPHLASWNITLRTCACPTLREPLFITLSSVYCVVLLTLTIRIKEADGFFITAELAAVLVAAIVCLCVFVAIESNLTWIAFYIAACLLTLLTPVFLSLRGSAQAQPQTQAQTRGLHRTQTQGPGLGLDYDSDPEESYSGGGIQQGRGSQTEGQGLPQNGAANIRVDASNGVVVTQKGTGGGGLGGDEVRRFSVMSMSTGEESQLSQLSQLGGLGGLGGFRTSGQAHHRRALSNDLPSPLSLSATGTQQSLFQGQGQSPTHTITVFPTAIMPTAGAVGGGRRGPHGSGSKLPPLPGIGLSPPGFAQGRRPGPGSGSGSGSGPNLANIIPNGSGFGSPAGHRRSVSQATPASRRSRHALVMSMASIGELSPSSGSGSGSGSGLNSPGGLPGASMPAATVFLTSGPAPNLAQLSLFAGPGEPGSGLGSGLGSGVGRVRDYVDPKLRARLRELHAQRRTPSCVQVIRSPEGFLSFERFLVSEFSVENLHFWRAVHKFKALARKGRSAEALNQLAREIYDKFIREFAPFEINLSGMLRRQVAGGLQVLGMNQPVVRVPAPGLASSLASGLASLRPRRQTRGGRVVPLPFPLPPSPLPPSPSADLVPNIRLSPTRAAPTRPDSDPEVEPAPASATGARPDSDPEVESARAPVAGAGAGAGTAPASSDEAKTRIESTGCESEPESQPIRGVSGRRPGIGPMSSSLPGAPDPASGPSSPAPSSPAGDPLSPPAGPVVVRPTLVKSPARGVLELDGHKERIFDLTQKEVYNLMARDSFPRYLCSQLYRDLLGKALNDPFAQSQAQSQSQSQAQALGQANGRTQHVPNTAVKSGESGSGGDVTLSSGTSGNSGNSGDSADAQSRCVSGPS